MTTAVTKYCSLTDPLYSQDALQKKEWMLLGSARNLMRACL